MTARIDAVTAEAAQAAQNRHPSAMEGSAGDTAPQRPSWTFLLRGRLVPPNVARRQHWAARRRAEAVLATDLAWQVRTVRPVHTPQRISIRATLTHRSARYALDPDNAVAGLKPLIDQLVRGGLVADDGPAHVAILPVAQQVGDRDEVKLEIWEV